MAFEDYDVEYGYSLSDLRRSYSKKAYALPDYEARSLAEIEHSMDAGSYNERSECMDHLAYLEDLQKKLSFIAMAEEREGIMNWELREVLGVIKKLAARLSSLSEQMPTVIVYKMS
ncbi:hypothetical protein HYU17_04460 [Candidatus Woesearchaeota archaeon]|nr:hypothetical protein [Candidatus Woesearchaeota archaeon]